ncbi:MAG: putative toxin-antitoxin system toxin component, PIN family [Nitrospirae bacterium]|nr:putative toxin-antitoxin system toxin component, PIN family [Nitrospirota bacterium]
MIRVVIDANQFVSALLKPVSNPAEVIRMAREGKIQLITSSDIIEEISAVLLYPKIMKRHRRTPEQIEVFLKKLTKAAVITHSGLRLDVIKDDASDNKYLECAVEGGAHYIISGDKHLTDLKSFRGIKIIEPAHFLKNIVVE